MSYQVGSQCFNTELSALQFMASSMFGAGRSSEGQLYSYYTQVSGNTLVTYNSLGDSVVIQPSIPECQLLDISDAVTYSGSIAVLFVIAVCFRHLFYLAKPEFGS